MKKIVVFFVVSLISIFAFASCADFQLANDCNGNSTTVIAKNDTVRLDIHANWNQGIISYKFQSGPEKLNMSIYTNDMDRLYTEVTYKNKTARMYYDFNLAQMASDDMASLLSLIQSMNPTFLAQIQILADDLPSNTGNLNLLADLASALVTQNADVIHPMDIWGPGIYAVCYYACVIGGGGWLSCGDYCHDKYLASGGNK